MSNFEFTRLKYSGSDTQILALINQLLNAPENPPVQESASPEAAVAVTDEPEKLQAIAQRFFQLLKESTARGSLGQTAAMTRWLLQDGKAEIKDLVAATGVQDARKYAPIGSALTRNMAKAGGPAKSCTGVPHFPEAWYGWIKEADGREVYIIEQKLLPYLKAAFQTEN
jgi:hypothetical protein